MSVNILFLSGVFFVGAVTAYEDFKSGKIRNIWIITGIVWGVLSLFIFFLLKFFHLSDIVSYQYLGRVVINFICSILAGFLIWRFDGWSAGDAKLFMVFSLLIPLTFYWKSYLPIFPAFALLINIFFIIFAYIIGAAIIFYIRFVCVKFFKKDGLDKFKGEPFGYQDLLKIVSRNTRAVGLVFIFKFLIKNILGFHLKNKGANKKIKVEELRPNAKLAPYYFKKTFQKEIDENPEFGEVGREGLDERQAELLRKWSAEKNIGELKILKTFPFAIWMFAGVILTLLIKMSVINFILAAFRSKLIF